MYIHMCTYIVVTSLCPSSQHYCLPVTSMLDIMQYHLDLAGISHVRIDGT